MAAMSSTLEAYSAPGELSRADDGAGWPASAQRPLLMPAEVCSCGTVFLEDAGFCRRCGKARPSRPSSPPSVTGLTNLAASLPRPPLNTRVAQVHHVSPESRQHHWTHVPLAWRLPLVLLIVVVVVLRFFGTSLFGVAVTVPPWSVEAQCAISVSQYLASVLVQDQCEVLGDWQARAQVQSSEGVTGGCHMDAASKQIVCEQKAACQGGHVDERRWLESTHNATYDCGSHCVGTLLVDCCNLCLQLQPASLDFDGIVCRGCEPQRLQHIVDENSASCSRDPSGAFVCESKESCQVGKPTTMVVPRWYDCQVTPCNTCSNSQLHAECCAMCLQDMCSGPRQRLACKGCQRTTLQMLQ